MDISTILKNLRKERNKTQREVAKAIGTTERSYQRYEYGTREPKLDVIRKLALYYNVSADFLLGIEMTNK